MRKLELEEFIIYLVGAWGWRLPLSLVRRNDFELVLGGMAQWRIRARVKALLA